MLQRPWYRSARSPHAVALPVQQGGGEGVGGCADGVLDEAHPAGLEGVVFQFVSVDFTKLFHELVRPLFELVH